LLVYGDENFRRGIKDALLPSTDTIISFSLAASRNITTVANLGLEIVLQRKSRVLDVLADSLSRIRQNLAPEHQDLLARYQITTSELAKLGMSGPRDISASQYLAKMGDLKRDLADLEARISGHSSHFRSEISPVTLPQVQKALPPYAVLLEWVRYHPYNPKAIKREPQWGAPRYALYVLKPKGAPIVLDIGDAEVLEIQVNKLLSAVRRPGDRQRTQNLAGDLYRRLLQSVQAHLGSAKQLLIAPDGQLNLLPFGVLQDATGHSLADQYELTYLTSGRDLLRPAPPAEASRPSLLVADPAFDAATPATRTTTTETSNRRSADMDRSGLRFERLPGTAQEARDLRPVLKLDPSQVLTEARATETAVKQVQSPRILHLATHGFFLPNLPEAFPTLSRGATLDLLEQQQPPPQGENLLLRSGLVLAGANHGKSGNDDGFLTALEVSSLDLTGTQLAVLSACETGVGQLQNGEGAYGLRRALVLAGVRTQVVTLWKVDDAATQAFMGHYYRHVLDGMGRSAALRLTQQDMQKNPKKPEWADPYYWAAFVVIGDSTPLPPETGSLSPGAHLLPESRSIHAH
jgi:CHAT domain-containing protein